jgi:hypothetical protein
MTSAALLVTALLFGGMTLHSFGFAAFLFSALPAEVRKGLAPNRKPARLRRSDRDPRERTGTPLFTGG